MPPVLVASQNPRGGGGVAEMDVKNSGRGGRRINATGF